ncbi:glycosyl transferase [Vararia minispora EC-137]|uniref:Glycosyl transferase n=1 Tax=Vararia minispora EC-137 TaxID=1314806 RepID=A0ACB8QF81_9AGAM|nr:glycosyl transferase [Vararia minispora EC-137]
MPLLAGRLSRPAVLASVLALSLLSLFLLARGTIFSSLRSYGILTIPDSYYDDDRTRISHASSEPPATLLTRRANATFVMLARNSDADGAVRSVRDAEDRFNHAYGYPWVFLNEEPFSDDFKRRISNIVSGPVEFGVIPRDDWFQPAWIDEARAAETRLKMKENNIIYGGAWPACDPYRNMCRFNSGFFYRHPLMLKYRYYWRVEVLSGSRPDIHLHCDMRFDPFLFMMDHKKSYGFTITLYEFRATIETLWSTVREFIQKHPEHIAEDNALDFLSDDGGKTYNLCHFWSNFEIADMDLWRGPAYTAFFDYLDAKGGFYYERWGDAPVHSIAAALFTRKRDIHFFREIGYEHNPYIHCPTENELWERGKCACNQARSFDYDGYSCLSRWERSIGQ